MEIKDNGYSTRIQLYSFHEALMMWGRRAVRAFSSSSSRVDVGKRFVLIDGVRTPFLHAGTAYKGLMAHDLQVSHYYFLKIFFFIQFILKLTRDMPLPV